MNQLYRRYFVKDGGCNCRQCLQERYSSAQMVKCDQLRIDPNAADMKAEIEKLRTLTSNLNLWVDPIMAFLCQVKGLKIIIKPSIGGDYPRLGVYRMSGVYIGDVEFVSKQKGRFKMKTFCFYEPLPVLLAKAWEAKPSKTKPSGPRPRPKRNRPLPQTGDFSPTDEAQKVVPLQDWTWIPPPKPPISPKTLGKYLSAYKQTDLPVYNSFDREAIINILEGKGVKGPYTWKSADGVVVVDSLTALGKEVMGKEVTVKLAKQKAKRKEGKSKVILWHDGTDIVEPTQENLK